MKVLKSSPRVPVPDILIAFLMNTLDNFVYAMFHSIFEGK